MVTVSDEAILEVHDVSLLDGEEYCSHYDCKICKRRRKLDEEATWWVRNKSRSEIYTEVKELEAKAARYLKLLEVTIEHEWGSNFVRWNEDVAHWVLMDDDEEEEMIEVLEDEYNRDSGEA